MTETAARPPVNAGQIRQHLTDSAAGHLLEIIAHLEGRISHLETRVDEAGIPYRPDLMPDPGSFDHCYSADRGVCPSVTGVTR